MVMPSDSKKEPSVNQGIQSHRLFSHLDSSKRDTKQKGVYARTFRALIVIALVFSLLAWIANPGSSEAHTTQPSKTTLANTSQDTTDQQSKESTETPTTQRLIPDQRAFLGAPDTVIDLNQAFKSTKLNDTGETITYEILRAKDDVAAVEIDGHLMTLRWKKKTGKQREILIRATNSSGQQINSKFYVELWKPDYWKLIFTVVGGLGIFLLGMKSMSEGLQAIAGAGLRKMIGWVTNNRFMAVGVGTLITMLVQSSSITTVMVVGFVNSSFMTLQQSIGVIMGANIGTTITGWILVLKIGKYGLPIAGAAAFVYLFSNRDRLRFSAMAIMGLGFVFLGLELMKDGFSIIQDLPQFEAWFHRFSAGSYFGVLKCVAVGCILTFIVQSSSATLGITIGLAQIGVIEFDTAAALVLGENVGTTITAWLASFGTTINAKRAAYSHIIFNLLGVAWITAVFPYYMMVIRYFIAGDTAADLSLDASSPGTITAAIAATHTGFNVANTILFLPFSVLIARGLERFVPGQEEAGVKPHLTNLDVRMLESPAIAIEQSRLEVINMARNCEHLMQHLQSIEQSDSWSETQATEILHMEQKQDEMQIEFVQFMSNLLGANVPHSVIDEARHQIRLVDEYESISDCIATVFKSKRYLKKREREMPLGQRNDILEMHNQVSKYLNEVNRAYFDDDPAQLDAALEAGDSITKLAKALTKKINLLPPGEQLPPFESTSFSRQIAAYRRVRDHLVNIVEVLKGQK